jgi:hypothetical protein
MYLSLTACRAVALDLMLAVAMATGSVNALLSVAGALCASISPSNAQQQQQQVTELPPLALACLEELQSMKTDLELSFPAPMVS